jgi:hypothetical protein
MPEIGHELKGTDDVEGLDLDVEQDQLLGIVRLMRACKGVRAQELGRCLAGGPLLVGWHSVKDLLESLGEVSQEHFGRTGELRVGLFEGCDALWGEVEGIAARAEGVPAELPVPIPVQIGAVVLLEGDTAASRTGLGGGNLRVMG